MRPSAEEAATDLLEALVDAADGAGWEIDLSLVIDDDGVRIEGRAVPLIDAVADR